MRPQLPVQQGFWSVPLEAVSLTWPNGSSSTPTAACTGFTGTAASSSAATSSSSSSGGGQPAGCIGILDSGTSQIIGSIDQVAALNAALGGVPSLKQLPFDCGRLVATVLGATVQALSGSEDPEAAANQVRQGIGLRGVGSCRNEGLSNDALLWVLSRCRSPLPVVCKRVWDGHPARGVV